MGEKEAQVSDLLLWGPRAKALQGIQTLGEVWRVWFEQRDPLTSLGFTGSRST